MSDSPTNAEMAESIAAFLRDVAAPQLQGHEAFLARVAANAAMIVQRESLMGPIHNQADLIALNALLGQSYQDLTAANEAACAALRAGAMTAKTPGLLEAFEAIAARRVRIEQPSYPSLTRVQW
jgi:uncharacterized protein YcsI (UPF0317 family)